MKALIFLMFMSSAANADDWLCRTQASEQRGDSYLACGVATSRDENTARIQALKSAKNELQGLCPSCEIARVTPKRTECVANEYGFTCYRLIVFTPGPGAGPMALERFGEPVQISDVYFKPKARDYMFHGAMCVANDYCHAIVENGRITSLDRFKPQYMK